MIAAAPTAANDLFPWFSDEDVVGIDALDELVALENKQEKAKRDALWSDREPSAPFRHASSRLSGNPEVEPAPEAKWLTLAEMEADYLRRTLEEMFFNQSAAARVLGVDRKLLARKIRK